MSRKAGYRKCEACGRNRAARFYTGDRGRICATCRKNKRRTYSRDQRLQLLYGITIEEYDQLFAAQDGRCAICLGTRRQSLSVDHCHATGAVRGLLCRSCNGRLLTAARDNPETLQRAASYLQNYPADAVLGRRYVVEAPVKATATRRAGIDGAALPEAE